MFKWYNAEVIDQKTITPNTKQFWLKAESDAATNFRAGQFITLDLPISERRRERWRSYSLANPPNTDGLFELCIVLNPNGLGTNYLFDQVKIGDSLSYKGPDGGFYLPDTLDYDLVMVCTGTGLAPFRSMLLDVYGHKKPHQKMHLIFGTRHEENILYRAELEALSQKEPDFAYDVVLSKSPNWNGYQGHVHQVYEKYYDTPTANRKFYLCGWKSMIDEAEQRLLKLGYEKNQIITELYG